MTKDYIKTNREYVHIDDITLVDPETQKDFSSKYDSTLAGAAFYAAATCAFDFYIVLDYALSDSITPANLATYAIAGLVGAVCGGLTLSKLRTLREMSMADEQEPLELIVDN